MDNLTFRRTSRPVRRRMVNRTSSQFDTKIRLEIVVKVLAVQRPSPIPFDSALLRAPTPRTRTSIAIRERIREKNSR